MIKESWRRHCDFILLAHGTSKFQARRLPCDCQLVAVCAWLHCDVAQGIGLALFMGPMTQGSGCMPTQLVLMVHLCCSNVLQKDVTQLGMSIVEVELNEL
jgi:hypothetical protein